MSSSSDHLNLSPIAPSPADIHSSPPTEHQMEMAAIQNEFRAPPIDRSDAELPLSLSDELNQIPESSIAAPSPFRRVNIGGFIGKKTAERYVKDSTPEIVWLSDAEREKYTDKPAFFVHRRRFFHEPSVIDCPAKILCRGRMEESMADKSTLDATGADESKCTHSNAFYVNQFTKYNLQIKPFDSVLFSLQKHPAPSFAVAALEAARSSDPTRFAEAVQQKGEVFPSTNPSLLLLKIARISEFVAVIQCFDKVEYDHFAAMSIRTCPLHDFPVPPIQIHTQVGNPVSIIHYSSNTVDAIPFRYDYENCRTADDVNSDDDDEAGEEDERE